jgi:hypothetical protein
MCHRDATLTRVNSMLSVPSARRPIPLGPLLVLTPDCGYDRSMRCILMYIATLWKVTEPWAATSNQLRA